MGKCSGYEVKNTEEGAGLLFYFLCESIGRQCITTLGHIEFEEESR